MSDDLEKEVEEKAEKPGELLKKMLNYNEAIRKDRDDGDYSRDVLIDYLVTGVVGR